MRGEGDFVGLNGVLQVAVGGDVVCDARDEVVDLRLKGMVRNAA